MPKLPPGDPLAAHAHRKVRTVAREVGPHAEQLFALAAGTRKEWTRGDWQDVLDSLDACHEDVDTWRAVRG
jgi:hypothetical protein